MLVFDNSARTGDWSMNGRTYWVENRRICSNSGVMYRVLKCGVTADMAMPLAAELVELCETTPSST